MPNQKSFVQSHTQNGSVTTFNAPLDVCGDIFSSASSVTVTCSVVDGKKLTYHVVLSGGVYDTATGAYYNLTVTVTNANGKVKKFDNLDQVVALTKSALGTIQALTIGVTNLSVVRGDLRLSGDPATAAARALAKITAKKSDADALVVASQAGLNEIAYYQNGNALEQAYYIEKTNELASVTAYASWCGLEYTRLGGV